MSASPLAVVPLTPWAARLGYAGALPFIALAAAAWWAPSAYRAQATLALLCYGATIASFLGAIHWGLAMRGTSGPQAAALVWGVLPSLVAWAALLLTVRHGLLTMALLLGICLAIDQRTYASHGLEQWLPMRWHLTSVAIASLIVGSVAV